MLAKKQTHAVRSMFSQLSAVGNFQGSACHKEMESKESTAVLLSWGGRD